MPRSHPPYPPELRRRLVELVRAGRSPAELAGQFEPSEQCIRNRVKRPTATAVGARTGSRQRRRRS
jgi:transposase